MPDFVIKEYDRKASVSYAHQWAYTRNPEYYNFDSIGGDCTNFISQCLYAGTGVMNYTPVFGWFYKNLIERAAAWSGVTFLYNFLTTNNGAGPFGSEVGIDGALEGDLVQLAIGRENYQHTLIITSAGSSPDLNNILIAAHSYDSDNRPLATYAIKKVRFIHIEGYRCTGRDA